MRMYVQLLAHFVMDLALQSVVNVSSLPDANEKKKFLTFIARLSLKVSYTIKAQLSDIYHKLSNKK